MFDPMFTLHLTTLIFWAGVLMGIGVIIGAKAWKK